MLVFVRDSGVCMERALYLLTVATVLSVSALAHAAETKTYKYDAQGRLIEVRSTVNATPPRVTTYNYDKAHNRTLKTVRQL